MNSLISEQRHVAFDGHRVVYRVAGEGPALVVLRQNRVRLDLIQLRELRGSHQVFQIDPRMAGYDGITAGYLIRGDRPCLVETGTAPCAPVVRDALAQLGVGADDLATVVVTHIHLGQYYQPLGLRKTINGNLTAPVPVFWNVEKKSQS